jgi:hypothetical protein
MDKQLLRELRVRLRKMPKQELADFYQSAHDMCQLQLGGPPPREVFVQQLVQTWKEMTRREKRPRKTEPVLRVQIVRTPDGRGFLLGDASSVGSTANAIPFSAAALLEELLQRRASKSAARYFVRRVKKQSGTQVFAWRPRN